MKIVFNPFTGRFDIVGSSGGGSPTGPAGGDLSGTYPNPSVVWANGYSIYDSRYYSVNGGTLFGDAIMNTNVDIKGTSTNIFNSENTISLSKNPTGSPFGGMEFTSTSLTAPPPFNTNTAKLILSSLSTILEFTNSSDNTFSQILLNNSNLTINTLTNDGINNYYNQIFSGSGGIGLKSNTTGSTNIGYFKTTNLTANRNYELPDNSGTIALLSDIGPSVTASNGLTKTANDIALGGSLAQDTTITASSLYSLSFGTGASPVTNYYIYGTSNFLVNIEDSLYINSINAGGSGLQLNNQDLTLSTSTSLDLLTTEARLYYTTPIINSGILINSNGVGVFTGNSGFYGYFKTDNLTSDRTYQLPDNSGTIALTSDISGFITGSGTSGYMTYWSGASSITGNSNFTYNAVNNSLTLGSSPFTNSKIHTDGNVNSYLQNNIQNDNSGSSASSDWVATMDTGTDSVGYGDFGINSSTYSNVSFTAQGAGDVYLYAIPDGTNIGGNLVIGAASVGKSFKVHTGGALAANIRLTIDGGGNTIFTQGVQTTGTPIAFLLNAAAHTGLAASSEIVDVDFNLARTVQRAAGAVTTQRAILFRAPTYSFVSSSTITTASTIAITGAPIAGTNATISNSYSFWVQSGPAIFDGTVGTTQTTLNLFNTNATTINFGGAATGITIGNAAGTIAIASPTITSAGTVALWNTSTNVTVFQASTSTSLGATTGTLTLRNPTIVGSQTSATLWNTVATTVSFAGAATTFTVGGTPTTALTANFFTNATASATTKTINFATGGAAGSTTAINIGSAAGTATNITFNLPSSATGDIWYRNSSGFFTRLAIGTTNQVLTVSGGLPVWASFIGVQGLGTGTTSATVSNTTTETTILGTASGSKSITANTLSVGSVIRVTVYGTIAVGVASNINIRIKYGSTVLVLSQSNNTGLLTGTRQFNITADFTVITTGATGTVQGAGYFEFGTTSDIANTRWVLAPNAGPGSAVTIDTTTTTAIDVTAQWASASASNTIVGLQYSIEQIR